MNQHFVAGLGMSLLASAQQSETAQNATVDVVLIGGGIMSATLGTFIKELEPGWTVNLYERLDDIAQESSNGWNNAGTGHAAYCELNYTPQGPDGDIDIAKAVAVNESFEISRQFWAYLVKNHHVAAPETFITNVPHMSFVWGEEDVDFLRKRVTALRRSPLFRDMEYTEDSLLIKKWAPRVMAGRKPFQKMAATRVNAGTDVNFGELTRQMLASLAQREGFRQHNHHEVTDLARNEDQSWTVRVRDCHTGRLTSARARHVFIGAGGAALTLLQKSGIPEARGYAGFPVGGKFLVTTKPGIVNGHRAKVYGKAPVGAPPMSVPHIDARLLDGQPSLLFGPFATFSSKFLKQGSWRDLFYSLNRHNLLPMIHVGWDNLNLLTYLIGQALMSDKKRLSALQAYYPEADLADWRMIDAGQRVQIIKKDPVKGGVLQFGTELVSAADGSLSALLGASPGASTAAPIMLQLLTRMFPARSASADWVGKLRDIIPSHGQTLNDNPELALEIHAYTSRWLNLKPPAATSAASGWNPLPEAI
ncbi:malate dehydrogenase (quinone) [Martelella alba]|uniref:Probable malate:quinone oxidoreductase n=1 Tax=Martelella alba TaxID=2590451 RepID=A0ABY2SM43_9HYPH|nr:malate dehydrogenase (quinone) [Martelella alba]TKI06731.1 malate dehydrogenase (quinone) [Martelella alba]